MRQYVIAGILTLLTILLSYAMLSAAPLQPTINLMMEMGFTRSLNAYLKPAPGGECSVVVLLTNRDQVELPLRNAILCRDLLEDGEMGE